MRPTDPARVRAAIRARTLGLMMALGQALVACGGADDSGSARAADDSVPVAANVQLAGLVLAQQMAQTVPADSVGDAIRLVAGKPTLLKVDLITANVATAVPLLTVSAWRNEVQVDAMQMQAPTRLPVTADPYDLSTSFHGELPADWVQPGTRLELALQTRADAPVSWRRVLAPTIDPVPALKVTLVPMVIRGVAPQVPPVEQVRAVLARTFPLLDAASLQVQVRSAYVVSQPPSSAASLLDQLNTVHQAEADGQVYVGVANSQQLAFVGVGGIAYQNPLSNFASGHVMLTALIQDGTSLDTQETPFAFTPMYWVGTLVHELGHVFSRPHAPCSLLGRPAPSDPDPDYPYAGGTLGPAALFDAPSGYFGAPLTPAGAAMTDVMGYCDGVLFSDYNAAAVHLALQAHAARTTASALAAARAKASAVRAARPVLRGLIEAGRVTWLPMASADDEPVADDPQGSHQLRVRGSDGTEHRVRFTPVTLADAAGAAQAGFQLVVPDQGGIESLELLDLRAGGAPLAALRRDARVTAAATVQLQEADGVLTLRWDSAAEGWARLTHLDAAGRPQVLAAQLSGGQAVLDVRGAPAGGQWQVDLADALHTRRLTWTR